MSDYISRQAAIDALADWKISPIVLGPVPSADVVEVVRCKDCKKYNMDDCMMIYGKKMKRNIFAYDYCSYGERKDT